VASVVLSMVDEKTVVDFDDDALSAIEEGLAQAELGGFVSDELAADIDARRAEELLAYAGPPAPGCGDGSAGGEGRALHVLPVADQVGWLEPRPEVVVPPPGLFLSTANGRAPAVTLEQASNPAVTNE